MYHLQQAEEIGRQEKKNHQSLEKLPSLSFAITYNRNPKHKIKPQCCVLLHVSLKKHLLNKEHCMHKAMGSHRCNLFAFSPFSSSQLLAKAETKLFNSSRNFGRNNNTRQRQITADKDHKIQQLQTEDGQSLMGNKVHHF